jgi:hypothetical protein
MELVAAMDKTSIAMMARTITKRYQLLVFVIFHVCIPFILVFMQQKISLSYFVLFFLGLHILLQILDVKIAQIFFDVRKEDQRVFNCDPKYRSYSLIFFVAN